MVPKPSPERRATSARESAIRQRAALSCLLLIMLPPSIDSRKVPEQTFGRCGVYSGGLLDRVKTAEIVLFVILGNFGVPLAPIQIRAFPTARIRRRAT